MNGKRKGLGKGLDALLGLKEEGSEKPSSMGGSDGARQLQDLPIEWLQRGQYQPRQEMNPEALQELADSIREQGIMQPILVRVLGSGRYEIVAGERRWRAAQLAGLDTVPAIVKTLSDKETLAIALIENIQRENLNAIEEARALVRLQEEFGYSQQQVATAVGKSRPTVANLMRLTTLEKDVVIMLERGDLEMGHGRALLALSGLQQIEAARVVVGRALSVRDTEALVRNRLKPGGPPDAPADNTARRDPDIRILEQKVSELLGAGVQIAHRTNGRGKLTITYTSVEELEGILGHIK
tara:strand:+ start:63663 stop:64553 length:891 start_codon:yes stop_codon:yes gene_type:complete